VTFAKHTARAAPKAACPVHAYSSMEKELAVLPNSSVGGVKFSDEPRERISRVRANCPVHVYQEAKSELSRLGGATFARHVEAPPTANGPPVHAYSAQPSSLRAHEASFATFKPERTLQGTSGPPVHAYATPVSSLNKSGATAFSSDRSGRDGFQRTGDGAPVTAYAAPASTLKSTGGATFGTPRPTTLLPSVLSRSGLVPVAPSGAPVPPKAPRTRLPRLRVRVPPPVEEEKAAAGSGNDEDSPREIEATLIGM